LTVLKKVEPTFFEREGFVAERRAVSRNPEQRTKGRKSPQEKKADVQLQEKKCPPSKSTKAGGEKCGEDEEIEKFKKSRGGGCSEKKNRPREAYKNLWGKKD